MEQLKELIKKYSEAKFNFAECGSKKLTIEDEELVYKPRSQKEIETIKAKRADFEKLSEMLVSKFREKYKTRKIPKAMIGADKMARFISEDDKFLIDAYYQICDEASKKCDVLTLVSVMQTMELPMYFRDSIDGKICDLCSQTLPHLAISTGCDEKEFVESLPRYFCLLNLKGEDLKKLYEKSLALQKSQLVEPQMQ